MCNRKTDFASHKGPMGLDCISRGLESRMKLSDILFDPPHPKCKKRDDLDTC